MYVSMEQFQLPCTASQLQETYNTNIKDRCKLFLVVVIREVEKRVPASGEHLEVLSLLAPTDDSELSFTKLIPELKRLSECSIVTLENQWRGRKCVPVPPAVISDTVGNWIHLLSHKDSAGNLCFKELAAAALCLLSLPISNVECERVFSQVKFLKSDWRSGLH
ncbi:hypothetical protein Pcinc_026434 [Petrolisthes cinctipes]|uniref:HAT C-terminal dimerisation domain-containing protein n=1 Tax=Petrolisthes cinctipes TaxID=88211 RepID=A0AAE1F8E9_PETCI|nr:hypothetical protein Pcinc_026434 [Petrolisthes cinctipes]